VIAINGFDENEVLLYAASAEYGSEHPMGKAIVEAAADVGLHTRDVRDFQALRGKGVTASTDSRQLRVGSRRYIRDSGIETSGLDAKIDTLERGGKTTVLLAVDDSIAGAIAISDTIKDDSVAAIKQLKAMGFLTAMITGDNRHTAEAVGKEVGIDHLLAEVLPDQKVDEVRKLQETHGMVAMVGDGINDAPALAQADVGIAIGTGTDIAIEASDVILVRGDMSGVVRTVNLSKATFRKIKQNLFWALFYNLVMVPAAIVGWMHPVLAEIAMATSSITVVTNANLLRRARID
jgi:Cu+-exporting ATPase